VVDQRARFDDVGCIQLVQHGAVASLAGHRAPSGLS
jgi:hypothetical protein